MQPLVTKSLICLTDWDFSQKYTALSRHSATPKSLSNNSIRVDKAAWFNHYRRQIAMVVVQHRNLSQYSNRQLRCCYCCGKCIQGGPKRTALRRFKRVFTGQMTHAEVLYFRKLPIGFDPKNFFTSWTFRKRRQKTTVSIKYTDRTSWAAYYLPSSNYAIYHIFGPSVNS